MNPEAWKPINPEPPGDPMIVHKGRSVGKSLLIVGLPHERNDWVRRLFMERRPEWKPIFVAAQGSQLREFVETNFPNACVMIEPERLLTGAHELGLTEADLIGALERVKPPRPSPEAKIAEIAAELEKGKIKIPERMELTAATNDAAETWLDPSERGARRPRGFAKAKGWKAKQRAKRKAQRQARQRARG